MKILMLAPQPVVTPRGTPISVRDRCRALVDLGHTVELLTFPFGNDLGLPRVEVRRAPRIPGLRRVPVGFSWSKVILDVWIAIAAFMALARHRHALVHTHEEAGLLGALLRRVFGTPHLYDMHSSLPEQFVNLDITRSRAVLWVMRFFERVIVRGADAIIAISPWLRDHVVTLDESVKVIVVENLPQVAGNPPSEEEAIERRHALALNGAFVIGYAGTLESNQGIDLLIAALPLVLREVPKACLIIAGGTPHQVEELRMLCRDKGLEGSCRLLGQLPIEHVPPLLAACDVLVSPRSRGGNPPLKIYTYMNIGKPIVATNIAAHTQVLDEETASLAEPSPEALAAALVEMHADRDRGAMLGRAAAERARERHGYAEYRDKVASAVAQALTGAENRRSRGV